MSGAESTSERRLQHPAPPGPQHHQDRQAPNDPTYRGTGAPPLPPPRVWRAGRESIHILLETWKDLQRMTKKLIFDFDFDFDFNKTPTVNNERRKNISKMK
jgi:hypothetical protein